MLQEPFSISKATESDIQELEKQLVEKDRLLQNLQQNMKSDRETEKIKKEFERTKTDLAMKDQMLEQEVSLVKDLSEQVRTLQATIRAGESMRGPNQL